MAREILKRVAEFKGVKEKDVATKLDVGALHEQTGASNGLEYDFSRYSVTNARTVACIPIFYGWTDSAMEWAW
jgi:hypothetical protein